MWFSSQTMCCFVPCSSRCSCCFRSDPHWSHQSLDTDRCSCPGNTHTSLRKQSMHVCTSIVWIIHMSKVFTTSARRLFKSINQNNEQMSVFPHGGLSVDAAVGFAQSFDDLQSVQQLVGAFNPQQLLPAQTLPVLHTNKQTWQKKHNNFNLRSR